MPTKVLRKFKSLDRNFGVLVQSKIAGIQFQLEVRLTIPMFGGLDRPALAGVVRELEGQEGLDEFLATNPGHVTTRFRQAIGLVVRIIMENNGWRKTGRKGSLGVRTKPKVAIPKTGAATNTGGLSVWFTRAERYEPKDGMPYRSVEQRSEEIQLLYVFPFLEID